MAPTSFVDVIKTENNNVSPGSYRTAGISNSNRYQNYLDQANPRSEESLKNAVTSHFEPNLGSNISIVT